jgi:cell wall-associated NlpC family hydrolase
MTMLHDSDLAAFRDPSIAPAVTPTLAPVPPVSKPAMRRRRVILALTALAAAAALAAVGTASVAAWAAFGFVVVLLGAYGALLHRSSRLATEREFRLVMGPHADFFDDLASLPLLPEGAEVDTVVALDAVPAWRQALAVARFSASYLAGWALAPVVFALTLLVGRTPKDTTGQRWLANLQSAQHTLKDQSMRTLVVSAATTASVTGTVAVLGGGVAGATPISASAGMPAAVSVTQAAGVGAASVAPTSVYRVQSGDTLSSIADSFGTTWEALAAANRISDPNFIYVGQVISVPGGGGSGSAASPSSGTYTVQSGDTLSSIAARFGTNWEALASINGVANPNFIEVGQVLRLSGMASQGAPTGSASAPITPTVEAQPAPAPAPSVSNRAEIAVRAALAQVGKPYVWGGSGPNGFDCSGLVMFAWAQAGLSLPHYSVSQYSDTTRVSRSQLQPGDLVFYDTGDGAQPGHVTMYIGNGQIVTADSPGTDIRVEVLDWDGAPIGYGRVG